MKKIKLFGITIFSIEDEEEKTLEYYDIKNGKKWLEKNESNKLKL